MKKKLALLMAAIMTVAMVPATVFAATNITAVEEVHVAKGNKFSSKVELSKDGALSTVDKNFDVDIYLTNGKFTDDMNVKEEDAVEGSGVLKVDVISKTHARVTLDKDMFNEKVCTVTIKAESVDAGDVVAEFKSNVSVFSTVKAVIATSHSDKLEIKSEGTTTFVEDADDDAKEIKNISIKGLTNAALKDQTIKLKLKGNYKFAKSKIEVSFLNDKDVKTKIDGNADELTISLSNINPSQWSEMTISGIKVEPTKKCKSGDVATLTVSGKELPTTKLEVAKMVEEAVSYSVEDKKLPLIYAGKDYTKDKLETLELSIEENTGDILNTSRKATFTFPEGIEVVDAMFDGVKDSKHNGKFTYDIDENVVTIKNYSKDAESDKTDMDVKFVLNAAPDFSGDVKVTLGGEFDKTEFKLATVKAPYTIEAKTSQVLIDYRFVPVNDIVITEAEDGILEDGSVITLEVEKMNFEKSGSYDVTKGDIEVDVDVNDRKKDSTLTLTVKDESTEASTIVISGLELYLDRTLPVGGYALRNVQSKNILWENSSDSKKNYDEDGIFKYSPITVNNKYVEVVTNGRDQDDSSVSKKIVITIGAPTMAVGTETITLDTPAYINAENYTELPLRAVSEAFGAQVAWDDSSRTVTILMGQRIVSMAIGSKTMYINGTPVAMNTAPEITNSRTFVPVRDLASALGISKVDWNEASKTVTLN